MFGIIIIKLIFLTVAAAKTCDFLLLQILLFVILVKFDRYIGWSEVVNFLMFVAHMSEHVLRTAKEVNHSNVCNAVIRKETLHPCEPNFLARLKRGTT